MGYIAVYKDIEHSVDVRHLNDSKFIIKLDGKEYVVDMVNTEHSLYSMLLNERTYEIDLEAKNGSCSIYINGEHYAVEVVNEKKKAKLRETKNHIVAGKQEIKASMCGKVKKVLIALNDEVKESQGIIIIEAMKMENEICAPKSGKVTAVGVKEGDTVDNNSMLLVIE